MSEPASTQVTIQSGELGQLLEISQLFLSLSIVVQGATDPRIVDPLLTRLHQLRPMLERFTAVAMVVKIKPPVEVLNLMAQKKLLSLTAVVEAIRMCTTSAHMFQRLVISAMKALPAQAVAQVKVDPRKMH